MTRRRAVIAEIKIPPILKIGGGSFAAVASLLQRLECKRSLIVTDPWMMKNQLAERLASADERRWTEL